MINFFRKIRQRLLSENRFSKYLIYAIGEIALVMIGILLALQVNTWQIEHDNKVKEQTYLKGIKDDLQKDRDLIAHLIPEYFEQRIDFFNLSDSLVRMESEQIRKLPVERIEKLYWPPRTFFPYVGSYASLIADNSTFYITNKELLHQIRAIYDIEYQRIDYVGLILDNMATDIQWERRKDTRTQYSDYTMEDYESLYTDIYRIHQTIVYYTSKLREQLDQLDLCISAIDKELNHN